MGQNVSAAKVEGSIVTNPGVVKQTQGIDVVAGDSSTYKKVYGVKPKYVGGKNRTGALKGCRTRKTTSLLIGT